MVRNLSKFSYHVLETMHLMKERDPLTITAAGLSVANALAESFNLPQLSPMESYLSSLDVEHGFGHLPILIFTSELFSSIDKDTVFSSENEELVELKLTKDSSLYIVQYKNSTDSYRQNRRDDVGMDFFYTKGFNFDMLFDRLWSLYPYGIYLKRNKQTHTLEIRSLPAAKPEYVGRYDLEKFCARLRKSQMEGISRSFLFHGPPGVGKTTSVLQIAYRHFNRIIKIDPAIARTLETGELEYFINQLRPQILVFEDFDRAYSSVDVALFMLENIKQAHPEVIIFGTVNSLAKLDPALLRPGRFDKMMYFGYPQEHEYATIVNMYFTQYNPKVDQEIRDRIASQAVGLSPAYLKELAIESRNFADESFQQELEDTIAEYRQRIAREKKAFESSDGSAAEELDSSDDFEDEDDEDAVHTGLSLLKEIKEGLTPEEWRSLRNQLIETYAGDVDPEQVEDL
jgi:MoxR-like ATPase